MLSFKLFAGTDKGLRDNNEDNFTVCPDLKLNNWMVPSDERTPIQLGKRGCIMVVADGMGGQNAGEVASAIAIDTVQEMFSPANMPADILEKSDSIKKYLRKVISEADLRVKSRSEEDVTTTGMGSTIVMAWIIGYKAYIAWLGDSRAYSYIPGKGIGRLSKDHSYVQKLVDAGSLTEEEAMVHQDSNIITRSLGDTSQRAKPEVMEYTLSKNEVILLCSDGLCGCCLDGEIGGIIERNTGSLKRCKEELTEAALKAGGSDNITIALFKVVKLNSQGDVRNSDADIIRKKVGSFWNVTNIVAIFFIVAIVSCLCYAGIELINDPEEPEKKQVSVKKDPDKENNAIGKDDSTKRGIKQIQEQKVEQKDSAPDTSNVFGSAPDTSNVFGSAPDTSKNVLQKVNGYVPLVTRTDSKGKDTQNKQKIVKQQNKVKQ